MNPILRHKRLPLWALVCLAGLLRLPGVAMAGNTHAGTGDAATEQRAWWGDAFSSGYVVATPAGLCFPLTSAGMSVHIGACRMYAVQAGPPRQLEYIEDGTTRIVTVTAGDGQYWFVGHASLSVVVSGWTRAPGTHYLWQKSVSQPALPNRASWLFGMTVSAGAITGYTDLRTIGSPINVTFLGLTDTPNSYAGQSLKSIRVKGDETGLEFTDPGAGPGGGDNIQINSTPVDTTANMVDSTGLTWSRVAGPVGGPDTVSLLLNTPLLDLADNILTGSRLGVFSHLAQPFPLGTTTPDITTVETSFWVTSDAVLYTDFIDGNDHSEFTETRFLFLTIAHVGAGIQCSNTAVFLCNAGMDWTGQEGEVVSCVWTPENAKWFCQVPATAVVAPSLDQVFDAGPQIDGAVSLGTAVKLGGATHAWHFYQDGTGVLWRKACDVTGANCVTPSLQMEPGSDFLLLNESGSPCGGFDSVTGAWQPITGGTCAANLVTLAGVQNLSDKTLITPTIQGGSSLRQKTSVTTNPYTMLPTDCGKTLFLETGAGEIDLLADPTGGITNGACLVCFYARVAVVLLLDPNSLDSIQGTDNTGAALTLAAGDRLQLAAAVGNNVCLQGYDAATWIVWPGIGALTDGN